MSADSSKTNGAILFKYHRLQKGLTQRDLANLLGCSQTTIYFHEQGKYFNVKIIKKLLKLCNSKHTLDDFFDDYTRVGDDSDI